MGGDLGQVGDAQDLVARASAHRLRPTGSALRPPMPVSISSKTRVGVASAAARTSLIARATRLSSPPEAIRASGRAGSPGFGAMRKTTSSIPAGVEGDGVAIDLDGRLVGGGRRRPTATSNTSAGKPSVLEGEADGRDRVAAAVDRLARDRLCGGGGDLVQQARRRRRRVGPARSSSVAESLGLRRRSLAVGDAPPPRRRRTVARARRSATDAPRARPSAAGSWSTSSARSRASAATSSSSASRPASRSASGSNRASSGASAPAASRRATADRFAGAAPLPDQRLVDRRRPRRDRLAVLGRRRGAPRISSASPGRRRAAAISVASCSAISSRRSSSRGSSASSARAARLSRQRSTAVATAARSAS